MFLVFYQARRPDTILDWLEGFVDCVESNISLIFSGLVSFTVVSWPFGSSFNQLQKSPVI